jgi:hypothetical protein
MRAIDLHSDTRDLMAATCRSCTWWQTLPGETGDDEVRLSWERAVEDENGFFGRALVDGDAVIGWMQVAPAALVRRARHLPAGPPSRDAFLLTCAYFYDEEFLVGFQQLLQEIEYALKHRQATALEAFAASAVADEDRFRGYLRELNLFNPQVLEGNGFRRIRRAPGVDRYRLDLATLIATPRESRLYEKRATNTAAQPV